MSSGGFPPLYQRAIEALTACYAVDECRDWPDQSEALASYMRQSNDQQLRRMAERIQRRAAKRLSVERNGKAALEWMLKTCDQRGAS